MGPILEWIASLDESPLDTIRLESLSSASKEKESIDNDPLAEDMPSVL